MNNYNYKRLCPFKWFVLQNFPFIEADFDAITNYQLFCKLGEEINKLIDNLNLTGNQVENLTNAFNDLQNYVDNYFENLDIETEIDAKLDEMAENGTLAEIIEAYLNVNSIIIFDTVADMKESEVLQNGSVAKTLGFYSKNDGGGAIYNIIEDNELNYDNHFVHLLDNGLKAKIIIENDNISILQIGGKRFDTTFDNKNTILSYIEYNENSSIKFDLFFPFGVYYTSPVAINSNSFGLIGESSVYGKSIITAIADQEYVIKIGDYSAGCGYYKITGLTISTAVYSTHLSVQSYHEVSIACLVLSYTYFISSDYLQFANIKGVALKIDSSWEMWFNNINFSHINAFGKACLVFDTCNTEIFDGNANLSDSNFEDLRFEQIIGDCIHMKNDCKLINLHFGTINLEPSRIQDMGITFSDVTGEETFEDINCLIRLYGDAIFDIDTIQASNFYFRYYTINNKNYVYGDFIRIESHNILYKIIINNLTMRYARTQTVCLLKSLSYQDNPYSKIIFNNIINDCNKNLKVQARLCGSIILKDSLSGQNQYNDNLYQYNAIPCYKNVQLCNLTSYGTVTYDDDSINSDKLVIACHDEMTGVGKRIFAFICSSQTLTVRAKVQNSQTLHTAIYYYNEINDTWENLISDSSGELVGTGEYKNYTININSANALNHLCYYQLANDNEHYYARFDTYIN